jgi:hypothetical protein
MARHDHLKVPSPSAWLAPGEGRRQRGGAIVLLFGQVFTLNRYPGGNSRKPHHIAEEAPKELAEVHALCSQLEDR